MLGKNLVFINCMQITTAHNQSENTRRIKKSADCPTIRNTFCVVNFSGKSFL